MLMVTMENFLNDPSRRNNYVSHPDFRLLYLRKTPVFVKVDNVNYWCENVVTVANIQAYHKDEGAFSRLTKDFVDRGLAIHVECVHSQTFVDKLFYMGFIQVNLIDRNFLYNFDGHLIKAPIHRSAFIS